MALVKVIGIKATPKATIKYIENKEKTMQEELITGINTIPDPGVASNKMKMYRDREHEYLKYMDIKNFLYIKEVFLF